MHKYIQYYITFIFLGTYLLNFLKCSWLSSCTFCLLPTINHLPPLTITLKTLFSSLLYQTIYILNIFFFFFFWFTESKFLKSSITENIFILPSHQHGIVARYGNMDGYSSSLRTLKTLLHFSLASSITVVKHKIISTLNFYYIWPVFYLQRYLGCSLCPLAYEISKHVMM